MAEPDIMHADHISFANGFSNGTYATKSEATLFCDQHKKLNFSVLFKMLTEDELEAGRMLLYYNRLALERKATKRAKRKERVRLSNIKKESNLNQRKNWTVVKYARIKQVMRSLGRYERQQESQTKARAIRKTRPYAILEDRLKTKWHGITVQDVLNKFGEHPNCYLTGLPIDYNNGKTYHLDHVKPRSKGGPNTLENMQLAHPIANTFKSDLDLAEFIGLCHLIAKKHPREVIPD